MYDGVRFTDIRRFEELDSTNRYLLDEARAGAPEGLVVAAGHQTAGRGRLGRRWEAPAGANLLVSVLLRPSLPLEELHLCTAAVALAARSACGQAAAVEPTLKWPNDLMVGERKLGGVLAEAIGVGDPGPPDRRAIVVGLGLNVSWPAPEGEAGAVPVPPGFLGPTTSLWRESGRRPSPDDLLDAFLGQMEHRLVELDGAEGRRRLASDYRSACATVGQEVTVSLPGDETVTGSALDITAEGHLLVAVDACIRTISAGDVVHLRS